MRDFVESRRLLKNAETSSADGHETEPLPERVVNKQSFKQPLRLEAPT